MAKKSAKPPSQRSRAARRATSPGIDIDKSLKEFRPPSSKSASSRPSVLAAQHSAGVSKKKKTKAKMSSKARRRHERSMEMAEAVLERTTTKLKRSFGRERTVQERRKAWDTINKKAAEEEGGDDDSDNSDEAKQDGWETDEDMDGKDVGAGTGNGANGSEPASKTEDDGFLPIVEDEEIL